MSSNHLSSNEVDIAFAGNAPITNAAALQNVIAQLSSLSEEDRRRIIDTVATFFGLQAKGTEAPPYINADASTFPPNPRFQFSEPETVPSPKAFILQKSPKTDIERVACLAYYLSHYREMPNIKTKDISLINIESAHRALSNASDSMDKATKAGLLVPSVKGCKQLSAAAEQFVEALPDRDAANEIMTRIRQRRSGSSPKR